MVKIIFGLMIAFTFLKLEITTKEISGYVSLEKSISIEANVIDVSFVKSDKNIISYNCDDEKSFHCDSSDETLFMSYNYRNRISIVI